MNKEAANSQDKGLVENVTYSEFRFRDLRIVNMFREKTDEEIQKIVEFWRRNNALPRNEDPFDRLRQVVFAAFNPAEDVVAVNTVYADTLEPGGNVYFMYRLFIQPDSRTPWLMHYMTRGAYDFLQQADLPDKPVGLAITTENPKLMGRGLVRAFAREGCEFYGYDARGLHIWHVLF